MSILALTPSFHKDLDALKRNHSANFRKTAGILLELQRGEDVPANLRPDGRVPNSVKYELSDGHRVVFQKVENADAYIALAVGNHAHVDAFLDGHRGHVFDPRTGRMRELRLAAADQVSVPVVSSLHHATTPDDSLQAEQVNTVPLFNELTPMDLERLRVPSHLIPQLLQIVDANSLECMEVLQAVSEVSRSAGDLLLAFATGDRATRDMVSGVFRGSMDFREVVTRLDLAAIKSSSEEFLTFDDTADLEHLLERGTFEQWQCFLHPAQQTLVARTFEGPARIRGISGSGKTIVALHRARRIATSLSGRQRVLVTTFNKALSQAAARLLSSLCGPELERIQVTHLHRWCIDFLEFNGIANPGFSLDSIEDARVSAIRSLEPRMRSAIDDIPRDYLWNEIEFIMGRFLHEEASGFLVTDRSGRGRRLTADQREAILALYRTYMDLLRERRIVDPTEFARIAYRLRKEGTPPEHDYAAVIVDEVQDLSEISLKLLYSLVGHAPDGLLLVGDNTQRIYTRGFSMTGLGIDIGGRGVVLRKNYRNTRQILEAAFPLVAGAWDSDTRSSGLDPSELKPEFSVREGVRPIVVRTATPGAEAEFVAREINFLLQYDRYQPKDLCVMARTKEYRGRLLGALRTSGIPASDYVPQGDDLAHNVVRVSTLHNAKGHEFAAVFIVGATQGVFPPSKGIAAGEAEAGDERALLYVAMTRARDILYMSYSDDRGPRRRAGPSPLLREVMPWCDTFDLRRKQAAAAL